MYGRYSENGSKKPSGLDNKKANGSGENFTKEILESWCMLFDSFLEEFHLKLIGSHDSNQNLQQQNKKFTSGQHSSQKTSLKGNLDQKIREKLDGLLSEANLEPGSSDSKSITRTLQTTQKLLENLKVIYKRIDKFRNKNQNRINLNRYIEEITNSLLDLQLSRNVNKTVNFDIDSEKFPLDRVIPVILVINELVMKSIQQGYDDNATPSIMISLWDHENAGVLSVSNDGEKFDGNNVENNGSNSIELVKHLVSKQLSGSLIKGDPENGNSWTIIFPLGKSLNRMNKDNNGE